MTFHLAATIADVLAPASVRGGRGDAGGRRAERPSWAPPPEAGQTGVEPSIGADMDDKEIVEPHQRAGRRGAAARGGARRRGPERRRAGAQARARDHAGPDVGHAAPAPRQAQRRPGPRRGAAALGRHRRGLSAVGAASPAVRRRLTGGVGMRRIQRGGTGQRRPARAGCRWSRRASRTSRATRRSSRRAPRSARRPRTVPRSAGSELVDPVGQHDVALGRDMVEVGVEAQPARAQERSGQPLETVPAVERRERDVHVDEIVVHEVERGVDVERGQGRRNATTTSAGRGGRRRPESTSRRSLADRSSSVDLPQTPPGQRCRRPARPRPRAASTNSAS